jgi:hypothetical protein
MSRRRPGLAPEIPFAPEDVVAALEAPDCPCPFSCIPCTCAEARLTGDCSHPPRYPPPCRHVLAWSHGLTLEAWAELLAWLLPEEYAEPPRPRGVSAVQTRLARVALYATRAAIHPATRRPTARAVALWPGILDQEDVDDLGRQAHRCRNGAVDPHEALRPGGLVAPGDGASGGAGPLDIGWEALAPLRGRNRTAWARRGRRPRGILST